MSEFKHKNMTGSLFENSYKERDNQPDMTGKLVINDKTYQVAGWKNQTKNGGEYIKISVSDDEPQRRPEGKSYQSVGSKIPSKHMREYQKTKAQVDEVFSDNSDDIPF